jgi:PIN domain
VKIVIDTNALHQDWLLRSTVASLSKSRERAGCSLFVPEVVVMEHTKHFREARRTAASHLKQAARDVALLFGNPVKTPDLESAQDDCEERVRRRLEELGVGVLKHPDTSHEVLAVRAVSRHAPFSKDGRGYQDTLIWLSVLELLPSEEPVVVVSNDKAFGEKELEAQLVAEAARIAEDVPVYLARTLTEAFEKHVRPRLGRLDRFEAALEKGEAKLNLAEWLSQNLLSIVRDHESREAASRAEKPEFEWMAVEKPRFSILGAHALTDRDAYVRVRVEGTGHIGGWQWFHVGHDDFDRDWVEGEVEIAVELDLMISDEESVSGYTVLSVTHSAQGEPAEFDGHFDDDE